MKKWLRLVLFLAVAAVGFALRDTLLKELQQPLGVVGWVGLAASVVQIGQLVWPLFSDKKPARTDFTGLATTNADEIIRNHAGAVIEGITWIDRGIITVTDWHASRWVVLEGPMKSGKTTEAAMLIKRDASKHPGKVYDLTGITAQPAELVRERLRGIDRSAQVVFFYNELAADISERELDSLGECLNFLESCTPGFFITTVREEHLQSNPALAKWLQKWPVKPVSMPTLTTTQANSILQQAMQKIGLALDVECQDIIIRCGDGTPGHLLLTVTALCDSSQPVTPAMAETMAGRTKSELWGISRERLCRKEPGVGALLEAIQVFIMAGVAPFQPLVLAYARRCQPKGKRCNLRQAARLLAERDLLADGRFRIADFMLDPALTRASAIQRLEPFLLAYRRLLRGRLSVLNHNGDLLQAALVDLAWALLLTKSKDHLNRALALVGAAEKSAPSSAKLYFARGYILAESKHAEEAIAAYQAAIILDDQDAAAHNNLGVLLKEKDDLTGAEAEYREAIRLDERLAAAHYNLGALLLMRKQHLAEAEAALRQAIRLAPRWAMTHVYLGMLLAGKGDPHAAEASYREAIRLEPSSALGYYNLGNLLREMGDLVRAEAAYREAIRLDPEVREAYNGLGMLLQEQGDLNGAEAAYQEAIRLDSKNADTFINLGNLLRRQKRFAEAEKVYRTLIGFNPDRASAHSSLGVCLRALGQAVEAEQEFAEARRLSATDNAYNRACIAALCRDLDEAFDLLQKAIDEGHDPAWVAQDPDWEGLRADPRYLRIMAST